jgi:hypothetical protein
MNARPTQTSQAAKPDVEEPRKRRWWLLLIPVVILAAPPVVVILLNTGSPKLPAVDKRSTAVVHVQDMPVLGRLKVEGIRRLRERIASGRPARNPWTIVRMYWKHRRSASVYVRQTGQLMPRFDSEAWAILMVPIEGTRDEYHAYHYLQDGELAYLDGPDGVQVLVMPFSPAELHADLIPFKVPFLVEPDEPKGSRAASAGR